MKLRRTNTYADNGDDVDIDYNKDTKPTLIIGPALKQLHLSTINQWFMGLHYAESVLLNSTLSL